MESKNRKADNNSKRLPEEIHIGTTNGKRARNEEDSTTSPSAPSTGAKKPCTQQETPLSDFSTVSMSHSIVRSVVTGTSKQPPPPPPTPPPKPKEIVKILCFGSDTATRTRWIHNLTRRYDATSTSPSHVSSRFEVDYEKKDYTFHSLTGAERSVRIQFLHTDGRSGEAPPSTWEATRRKLDSALLIFDLRHIISLWETDTLESHLEEQRNSVNQWAHQWLPVSLLLANVSQDGRTIAPAVLLRVGDAVARSCRKARIRNWFFVGRESESSDGLDSTDAVLQSLVEQASLNPDIVAPGLDASASADKTTFGKETPAKSTETESQCKAAGETSKSKADALHKANGHEKVATVNTPDR